MDKSMWQTLRSLDFLHSSHKWPLTNVVMWVIQLNIADWVCSKTQILLETWKIQNQLQVQSWVFRKLNICSSQLDVQEANISVSQFHRVRDKCHWMLGLWMDGPPALDLSDAVIEVLQSSDSKTPTTQKNYANRGRVKELRETAASPSNLKLRKEGNQDIHQCEISITWPQTQIFLNVKQSCTMLKTMRQWSRWSWKDEVESWDTYPEPTESR